MAFQLYRGTNDQVTAYVGANGELVYNMTNHSLHINDGVTPGGHEIQNTAAIRDSLLDGVSDAYDTLKEVETYINSNEGNLANMLADFNSKVANLQSQIDALKLSVDSSGETTTYGFNTESTP